MKNARKRLLAVAVAIAVAGTMVLGMTACGGKKSGKVGNTATDIEIAYWNSGLDSAWLEAMIAAFEDEYPQYHVEYTASADSNSVQASYGLKEADTVDLYLGIRNYDTRYMEPLNDVLEATAKGDSKAIKEKFMENYLKLEKSADGNYYGLTYGGGVLSVAYNKSIFQEAGIMQLPRTTDELAVVCDKLYRKGYTPFAHFVGGGYWDFISEAWFAQADGMDYYLDNFYACTDEKGESPSKEALAKKDGRYKVLKTYEKFITPEYTMDGSNTTDHVLAQTKFLNGDAAMMINGSWLINEMKSAGKTDGFAMMKLPVISAITDRTETIKSDAVLRLVISAIDDVTDGTKDISEFKKGDGYEVDGNQISAEDWEIVRQARGIISANYSGESAYIPNYSAAKEGAKEFLKFLYSDKGYKIYTETLHIALPMNFCDGDVDTSEWTDYETIQYQILMQAESIASEYIASKHRIFTDGGASSFAGIYYIEKMCSKNTGDRKTADDVWAEIEDSIEKNYELNWLPNVK